MPRMEHGSTEHDDQAQPVSGPEQADTASELPTPNNWSPHPEAVGEGLSVTQSDVEQTGEAQDHVFSPIRCPECDSRRFMVIPGTPVKAKCFELDCGYVYTLTEAQIAHVEATNPQPGKSNAVQEKPRKPSQKGSNADVTNGTNVTEEQERDGDTEPAPKPKKGDKEKRQKRSYAGSKVELLLEKAEKGELSLAPPPSMGLIGQSTDDLIFDGADALVRASHAAAKLAKLYGEDFEAKWLLKTEWLRKLETDQRGRTRVNAALRWRPKFLARLAITNSPVIACRDTVPLSVVYKHRSEDTDFAAQWAAALDHAVQLLEDVCFKSAIEGDCKPVYWQGIKVGHIREYDSRLRVELLRAFRPDRYKTPGQTNININNDQRRVTIYTPEAAAEIHQRRTAALQRAKELEEGSRSENVIDVDAVIRKHG